MSVEKFHSSILDCILGINFLPAKIQGAVRFGSSTVRFAQTSRSTPLKALLPALPGHAHCRDHTSGGGSLHSAFLKAQALNPKIQDLKQHTKHPCSAKRVKPLENPHL